MKSSELRTGNLIDYNGIHCTVEIINGEVDEVYILGDSFYYGVNIKEIEGIPITKERLLVFGFVQDKIDKSFELNSFSIFLDKRIKDNIYLKSIDGFGNFTWNVASGLKVQYIHQLQNLYFALTNEELILNN